MFWTFSAQINGCERLFEVRSNSGYLLIVDWHKMCYRRNKSIFQGAVFFALLGGLGYTFYLYNIVSMDLEISKSEANRYLRKQESFSSQLQGIWQQNGDLYFCSIVFKVLVILLSSSLRTYSVPNNIKADLRLIGLKWISSLLFWLMQNWGFFLCTAEGENNLICVCSFRFPYFLLSFLNLC